jgi:Ca-activated chloride channel family protein
MNRLIIRPMVMSLLMGLALLGTFMAGCSSRYPALKRDSDTYAAQLEVAQLSTPTFELNSANQTGSPRGGGGGQGGQSLFGGSLGGEELWVIEKPRQQLAQRMKEQWSSTLGTRGTDAGRAVAPQDENEIPGTGQLVAKLPNQLVPIPLKHTDVKASIAGYIATVDVTQQYQNPYSEKIEAVYVFPLPTNAAVNEFVMTIGERKIRGIVREREEAQKIYENARAQGHVASLLTQERPNVFTQSVANIEPNKRIDVNIKYFHTLKYVDGSYEYVFPMVVGPRFNPPGATDGVGAKANGSAVGTTGQKTEVSYLKPNERNGHDISLSLEINAGVKVEEIKCINHQVKLDRPNDATARVALAPDDAIPNKDFVLRYKVAGKTVKSAVMAQRDEKNGGGYFTLMLFPPDSLKDLPRKPLEMVFTLDVSGSMSGKPIEQAKAAVRYALRNMRPDDSFNVIRFAGNAEQMSPRALPAEGDAVQAALKYIESMEAGGGTMMIEGIRKSLQVTPDPQRLRFVAFLTDGYIGNEREILTELHNLKGPSRVFSFGVGQATNRYLLDHMARLGQGCAAYLSLNDDAEKVMAKYFETISHPALTDLSIDWGGLQVSDVYPSKLPDLFVGRPVVITGRYSGNPDAATVRVHGKVGGEEREMALAVDVRNQATAHIGIAPVFARMKIADLADRALTESGGELAGEIKQVALEYGLMSAYTAFVAVDSSTRTAGDHGTSVAVPVPVPQGVKYETTVPE